MKWMIASDLHGSAYWCEKMIERYWEEKAGKLLLLGDILYHGPRNDLPRDYAPKRVIEMLNNMREQLLCIRGNCDCEVDQMVLQFPIMADYAALWLNGHMVWATHGHVYNMDNHPPFQKGDILLHGHTHIPAAQQFEDGYYYINPGSVSIPKAGSRNSYLVLEGSTFTLKDIEDGSVISSFTVE